HIVGMVGGERDSDRARGIRHRVATSGWEIEDRQSAVAESNAIFRARKQAYVIGSSAAQRRGHRQQVRVRGIFPEVPPSGNSAHFVNLKTNPGGVDPTCANNEGAK